MADNPFDIEIDDESISSGDFNEFMGGIEQQLKTMMMESAKAPKTAWEHWSAFSAAVDWNETWIRILLSFHVFVWLFVLVTRKNVDCQTVAFFFITVIVFMSERINSYASENWQLFSKQNYFDSHGVFMGLMVSGPLILVLLFQLVGDSQSYSLFLILNCMIG